MQEVYEGLNGKKYPKAGLEFQKGKGGKRLRAAETYLIAKNSTGKKSEARIER
jgi:hypothetical protein